MKKITVVKKDFDPEERDVFDIEVAEDHHYVIDGGVVSHNSGFIYASSIVVSMNKLKLKEDEDGNKISDVRGIRSKIKVAKSRYSKPFEDVEVRIPYDTGMDPYSGLIDMFEKHGVLVKDGNKLKYVANDGTEHKYFRKNITRELLDQIMREWKEDTSVPVGIDHGPAEVEDNEA